MILPGGSHNWNAAACSVTPAATGAAALGIQRHRKETPISSGASAASPSSNLSGAQQAPLMRWCISACETTSCSSFRAELDRPPRQVK